MRNLTFTQLDESLITALDLLQRAENGPPPFCFTIGRCSSSDVHVDHPSVSMEHAVLEVALSSSGEPRLKLLALETTNPTQITKHVSCSPGNKYSIKCGQSFMLGAVQCKIEPLED